MGWESNNVFQVLIVQGSTGSGVFVYSPSPGAGNLVASITAAAGTDIYGNPYQAGVTSYGTAPAGVFSQLLAGLVAIGATGQTAPLQLVSNSGGNDSLISELIGAGDVAARINLLSKTGSGSGQPQLVLTPVSPGAPLTAFFAEIQGDTSIAAAKAAGQLLRVANTTAVPTQPNALVTSAAAADRAIGVLVAGDTNARWQNHANGNQDWGTGAAAPDSFLGRLAANILGTFNGTDFAVDTAGHGFQVKEGTNAKQGTAVLVAGTVTVANTSVTANSRIFLTCQVPGGTPGFLRISARTAGTSFTILSSSATDTSTVAYEIFEPAP